MKILSLFIFLLSFFTCRDHQKMEGHWHLMKRGTDGKSELHVMDYYKDHGIWNKDETSDWTLFVRLDVLKNQVWIGNGECFMEEYTYKFKSDSLFFINAQNEIIYKGIKPPDEGWH